MVQRSGETEYNPGEWVAARFATAREYPPYLIDNLLSMPTYELEDGSMRIHDVVWGNCEIGDKPHDQLLLELARTPLFQRLQSIEQLTLGPDYATMPNTTDFSRWQHIWGSLVFVRKMTEDDPHFTDRERAVLELRTLLSDVGHTSFSHLGDWLFQGIDGGENLHDQDLKELLRVTGVGELLEAHGFGLDEVVFPEVEDWVECPSPDLCVDRVDYAMREILRWVVPTIPINFYLRPLQDPKSLFEITSDNKLAFKNAPLAKFFTAGFSILPTEHWGQPVHRLQLELLQTMVKGALVDETSETKLHPRDRLYGIDADFGHLFNTWDALFLNNTMKDIAVWQRRIFVQGRRHDLNTVFQGISDPKWRFPSFPDPLRPYSWEAKNFSKPLPPHIDIRAVKKDKKVQQGMQANRRGLEVSLPPLKARAIDPLVIVDGTEVRFSDLHPSYQRYLEEQKAVMEKGYRATILMRTDVAKRIVTANEAVEKEWQMALTRKRMSTVLAERVLDASFNTLLAGFDNVTDTSSSFHGNASDADE